LSAPPGRSLSVTGVVAIEVSPVTYGTLTTASLLAT
jgi:hypothetical protein